MLTVGSLFSGIGGFDLGLERAGMRTLWFSEIDGYCQRVLARHWPDVLLVPDVRDVGANSVPRVDVVCGGFPCQDISLAGKGAGIDGARSGLWSEMFRVVRELRPRYLIVENVPALLGRGVDRVLGDLASCGFDAEWDCLRASDVGAPHERERIWLVAYPNGGDGDPRLGSVTDGPASLQPGDNGARLGAGRGEWLEGPPESVRVAYGLPDWVDRNAALGNALVPQIAQWIGERIVSYELSEDLGPPVTSTAGARSNPEKTGSRLGPVTEER